MAVAGSRSRAGRLSVRRGRMPSGRRYAKFGPFRSSPSSRERESDQVQAVIVTAVLSAADRDPVVGAGPSCAAPNPRRAGTARPLAPAHIVLPDPRSKPTASLQRHERKFGLRPKRSSIAGLLRLVSRGVARYAGGMRYPDGGGPGRGGAGPPGAGPAGRGGDDRGRGQRPEGEDRSRRTWTSMPATASRLP